MWRRKLQETSNEHLARRYLLLFYYFKNGNDCGIDEGVGGFISSLEKERYL